jgi:hypothetical protein
MGHLGKVGSTALALNISHSSSLCFVGFGSFVLPPCLILFKRLHEILIAQLKNDDSHAFV